MGLSHCAGEGSTVERMYVGNAAVTDKGRWLALTSPLAKHLGEQ